MVNCPRCGRENPEENTFCGRCGLDLTEIGKHAPRPDDDEPMFCYRHPKEPTNLRCGRCESPICTRCVVIGPAGPRCKECAKQNIAVRPGAVVHEVKSGLSSILRMGPWTIYIWILLIGLVLGGIRGCTSLFDRGNPEPEHSQEEP